MIDSTKGNYHIHVDILNYSPNSLNILVLVEPKGVYHHLDNIYDKDYQYLLKYDFILTYDSFLLSKLKNAVHFNLNANRWVNPHNCDLKFGISTITGWKDTYPGHKLRLEVWNLQDKIMIPKDFFAAASKNGIQKDFKNKAIGSDRQSKNDALKMAFHLCIENNKYMNYYSEKILDCFVNKVIPVYWGCPNIGDFFDKNGIIHLSTNDAAQIIDVINSLTEIDYLRRIKSVEENYKRAMNVSNDYEHENGRCLMLQMSKLNLVKEKVAFLFLIDSKSHNHSQLWQEYLKDHERVSIYVHKFGDFQDTFLNKYVIDKELLIPTDESITKAMLNLLKCAQKNYLNKKFVFISETFIPSTSFDKLYAELISHNKCLFINPMWTKADHYCILDRDVIRHLDTDKLWIDFENQIAEALNDECFFANIIGKDSQKIIEQTGCDFVK
jgi:hypothetical protein